VNDAPSLARNSTRRAISMGSAMRPMGSEGKTVSLAACSPPNMPVSSGVIVEPGQIALMRMFLRATSSATDFVSPSTPPLAGAIYRCRRVPHDPEQRGRLDDCASALLDHVRHLMLKPQEDAALEVDANNGVEIGLAQFLKGTCLATDMVGTRARSW
jgi:hypothetical protein